MPPLCSSAEVILWDDSDIDFEAKCTAEWRVHARAVPTFGALDNAAIKAKAANGVDLFSLPILWPSVSKTDTLRRWCESHSTDLTTPLKSLSDCVLRDLSRMIQEDHFSPYGSNQGLKVVECAVIRNCGHSAQLKIDFNDDNMSDTQSEEPAVLSAIHDVGIPESSRDIVYLLIDDLLHMSGEKVERYFRVWSSSGACMLVSSTTARSFNAAGFLLEVSRPSSTVLRLK